MGLLDEGGFDALSMRSVADELGVETMSLYHWVRSKDELIRGVTDLVISEVEPPTRGRDWKAAIRRSAISYHDALSRHPWAASAMWSPRTHMSLARLRYMDALLTCLREAGFSAKMTYRAYHALDSHILGSTQWEAGYRSWARKVNAADATRTAMAQLPAEQHPYFHEHLHQHAAKATRGEKSDFEFGLDLILSALERDRRRR